MVRNYKPRNDREPDDGALVAHALKKLDKGKYLRDASNNLHIPKTTLIRLLMKNKIPEDTFQQPDGVEASTSALPEDIMPLHRLSIDASKTNMKRKLGSARVLTSTPEKDQLLE